MSICSVEHTRGCKGKGCKRVIQSTSPYEHCWECRRKMGERRKDKSYLYSDEPFGDPTWLTKRIV